MGFHKRIIEKGTYGELSKIKEELDEAYDALEQNQELMLLIELADIVGAVEGVAKKYNFSLEQLLQFARLRSEVAVEEEKSGNVRFGTAKINYNYNYANEIHG